MAGASRSLLSHREARPRRPVEIFEPWAPWIRRHQTLGDRDRNDASIVGDAPDHDRFEQVMSVGIHYHPEAAGRGQPSAAERRAYLGDIGSTRGLDRRGPHMEADPGRLHGIVGHGIGPAGEGAPLGYECTIF